MKNLHLALLGLMLLALVGCNTSQKYAANNAAGQRWLDEHGRGASIGVSGTWYSDEWGGARLAQSGRTVTGAMGNYNVRGVISGSRAYLLLHSNGWVYYTAVLTRPSHGTLSGFYSASVPFDVMDQRPLDLRRVQE